ncbi:MAG: ComF family protein, partial [Lachnospiraceae bacterium]|nr:ComF family protein [Lachnospiraceae bacterium]
VYPPRCPVCDRVADFRLRIHPACEKWLPLVKEPRCKKCSKPLSNKEDEYCFDCGRKHFSYESGIALYVYNAKMSDSMSALKYKNRKEYGSFYGHRLGKLCRKEILRMHPEAIVPVPVHPVRERRRGYNQAQVIAEALSEEIGVPVLANALIRTKKTMPQKELDDKGRLRNLLEAFGMREGCPDVSGRTLLLVDDIYTTGSTIEACTRVLLHAGAKRVYFATVCIGNGF